MTIDIDLFIEKLAAEVQDYNVPVVDLIAVQTHDPYKILVATILSARTRDEVTAKAAARLFKKAPDMEALALLGVGEISQLIYPVGFYNAKSRHLNLLPQVLRDEFATKIPDDVESLIKLPGVGRKTANLVVSVAFAKPAICVDTHVHRITNIWGYVATKTPLQTEMALRTKLPARYWRQINSILVAFGQGTCKPLRPHCDRCLLRDLCPRLGVTPRRIPTVAGGTAQVGAIRQLISWNVNGIRALEKKGFTDIVNDLDADVLALQEIKAMPEQLSEALLKLDGYYAYWFPAKRKGYAGVCTYTRIKPIDVRYGIGEAQFDDEGRVLTLEFADFFLINAYFPNAQHGLGRLAYKLAFNKAMLDFCNKLARQKTVVLTGDYNVAHQAIDLKNPKNNEKNPGYSPQERQSMDAFIAAGYIDTFRMFNQQAEQYSWWSYRFNARARNIGWRIDYFCVDKKSKSRVKAAAILNEVMGSDHCPVKIELQ